MITVEEFVAECERLMQESGFPANAAEFNEYATSSYHFCLRSKVKKLKPSLTVKRFVERIMFRCGGANLEGSKELARTLRRG